ncbi:hypothetical protein RUM43_014321 [Polyplax serrata]|uniref:Uncharacterized protein n=1 Tax=Polyplax serrata TaxID=468196 RepID=A0AAN8PGS5_POLSC
MLATCRDAKLTTCRKRFKFTLETPGTGYLSEYLSHLLFVTTDCYVLGGCDTFTPELSFFGGPCVEGRRSSALVSNGGERYVLEYSVSVLSLPPPSPTRDTDRVPECQKTSEESTGNGTSDYHRSEVRPVERLSTCLASSTSTRASDVGNGSRNVFQSDFRKQIARKNCGRCHAILFGTRRESDDGVQVNVFPLADHHDRVFLTGRRGGGRGGGGGGGGGLEMLSAEQIRKIFDGGAKQQKESSQLKKKKKVLCSRAHAEMKQSATLHKKERQAVCRTSGAK